MGYKNSDAKRKSDTAKSTKTMKVLHFHLYNTPDYILMSIIIGQWSEPK